MCIFKNDGRQGASSEMAISKRPVRKLGKAEEISFSLVRQLLERSLQFLEERQLLQAYPLDMARSTVHHACVRAVAWRLCTANNLVEREFDARHWSALFITSSFSVVSPLLFISNILFLFPSLIFSSIF